ncbi:MULTISPECIES: YijD family membrane protein [Hafnia]|jgi:FtsH-binding integral membrane protein|uniref:YijD family membrane protein n=2 Tax=Hafnia TaxID=568 RepID=A0A4Q9EVV7_9GAMM|nr:MULTISPECIES: YijD family membrane protein [Hafnia]AJR01518.1 Putative inner membrane protein [Enterobacteriaceae bacterium bta3-1]MCE9882384.1 YijD family membrane protein [Hafnia paralvei]MCE9907888.1 YijD family membrane protein [Hafnia paralvei]MCE9911764.1 YijD family membrane protein [Hafnia paralvei]MCE9946691.1 YijD family membrane protein [Hafnia paralvei]
MIKSRLDVGTLVLSLVAGLSISGSFAALFSSVVPFSVFPLLALVLSVYCLHQRYLNCSMPEGMPVLSSSCFLLGLLMYSAIVRVEYPEIGSNFMPTILCIVLVFWIAYRIKAFKKNAELDSDKDFHDPE